MYGAKLEAVSRLPDGTVSSVTTSQGPLACDVLILCDGHHGAKTLSDLFGLTLPLIPVRGYSCDIVPAKEGERLPLMRGEGVKWDMGGTAFMLNSFENHWRLSGYLDITPASEEFFDSARSLQLERAFDATFGKRLPTKYKFRNTKSLCRPVTPDDLPVVGPLKSSKNVFVHNGMGGFGNIGVGTAKVVAD